MELWYFVWILIMTVQCLHLVLQHGSTALHLAAGTGHIDIIQFLQEKGIDLQATDKVR